MFSQSRPRLNLVNSMVRMILFKGAILNQLPEGSFNVAIYYLPVLSVEVADSCIFDALPSAAGGPHTPWQGLSDSMSAHPDKLFQISLGTVFCFFPPSTYFGIPSYSAIRMFVSTLGTTAFNIILCNTKRNGVEDVVKMI